MPLSKYCGWLNKWKNIPYTKVVNSQNGRNYCKLEPEPLRHFRIYSVIINMYKRRPELLNSSLHHWGISSWRQLNWHKCQLHMCWLKKNLQCYRYCSHKTEAESGPNLCWLLIMLATVGQGQSGSRPKCRGHLAESCIMTIMRIFSHRQLQRKEAQYVFMCLQYSLRTHCLDNWTYNYLIIYKIIKHQWQDCTVWAAWKASSDNLIRTRSTKATNTIRAVLFSLTQRTNQV